MKSACQKQSGWPLSSVPIIPESRYPSISDSTPRMAAACRSSFGPDLAEAIADRIRVGVVVDLPHFAVGGRHHHDVLPGIRIAGQGAAHGERLVVGVGVERQQAGHGGRD